MIRFTLAFVLAVTAISAGATNWPWQDAPEERLDYCKGFVVGGLASTQPAGNQRTDLWLAWNYIIRSSEDPGAANDDYRQGRAHFDSLAQAANVQGMLEEADSTCAMGRG